jgi:hypothetical protein
MAMILEATVPKRKQAQAMCSVGIAEVTFPMWPRKAYIATENGRWVKVMDKRSAG